MNVKGTRGFSESPQNLEPTEAGAEEQKTLSEPADTPNGNKNLSDEEWQAFPDMAVWNANRKIFSYPENWITPEERPPDESSEQLSTDELLDHLPEGVLTPEDDTALNSIVRQEDDDNPDTKKPRK